MQSRKSVLATQYSSFLKANPDLDDVLNNDRTVDEICCLNPEFPSYITREIVQQLIRYIIEEPLDPANTLQACKFPLVASEFFTNDLPCISKILFQEPGLIHYLFSFITREGPLNFLLAGYFQKAFESCYSYNSEEFLTIIFKESLHITMLKHIKSSSIADIVYLILTSKGDLDKRHELLAETTKLISSKNYMVSFNASGILCRISKEEEIYQYFISEMIIGQILDKISSADIWVVRNAGNVIKCILGSSGDLVVQYINKRIGQFADILCGESEGKILMQFGVEVQSFGEHRLIILELFVLLCNFPSLVSEISKEIERIVLLLEKYKWSSYFHHAFTVFIEALLNSSAKEYIEALVNADFPQILIDIATYNVLDCKKYSTTIGCTGHVYKMINLLVNSKIDSISTSMGIIDGWELFQVKLDCYNDIERETVNGKSNINFFENMSSEDSYEKAEENDLIPDYPYTKPITGKELEELTDLFDIEDKKLQKNTFMSTKCITNATLAELAANEYLDNVYWKPNLNTCHLDELE
ncbi:hypothetical protein SteCoe_26160 [Stentor coeruleus]|uniref:Serine/threonine-protein phosphatase 4 regulatory subunit 3-like central domain-containing protein n=1 Tax=Stentor coeruleus TaxID=5963 RepID=A0A1R2BDH0_9CILI|nr:hypothetical protein SteCoe_26160 [Stentor coeruleus]